MMQVAKSDRCLLVLSFLYFSALINKKGALKKIRKYKG